MHGVVLKCQDIHSIEDRGLIRIPALGRESTLTNGTRQATNCRNAAKNILNQITDMPGH
jgi:hypothetical protein